MAFNACRIISLTTLPVIIQSVHVDAADQTVHDIRAHLPHGNGVRPDAFIGVKGSGAFGQADHSVFRCGVCSTCCRFLVRLVLPGICSIGQRLEHSNKQQVNGNQ